MPDKVFKITRDAILSMAPGHGGCLATDRITVDGARIGYMYRERPHSEQDSGWRFFAGDEDESYMADAQKHSVYDVNTIANYDPEIIPHLSAGVGSSFERDESGTLVQVSDDA